MLHCSGNRLIHDPGLSAEELSNAQLVPTNVDSGRRDEVTIVREFEKGNLKRRAEIARNLRACYGQTFHTWLDVDHTV